ncbi:hypothetical protein [Streptomyces liangshanensis]|uniref:hypothetical protein n=1 Tax=Streptomyces liangshanensis TaxID=2717324 RepID=UPI0036DB4C1F
MPKTPAPWFETLYDGVHALGQTANEYRNALAAAKLSVAGVDIDRVNTVPGRVRYPAAPGTIRSPHAREPHPHAVFELGNLYRDLEDTLKKRFEQAARDYAHGAVWAVCQVLVEDATPDVVCPPDHLGEMPDLGYTRAANLKAARAVVDRCLTAAEYGEDLAGREYVADHEASDMFDAWQVADGIGEAHFAYGRLAEGAVHFALLAPRAAWRAQQAAALQG